LQSQALDQVRHVVVLFVRVDIVALIIMIVIVRVVVSVGGGKMTGFDKQSNKN
jgi:hypothetical protein